VAPRRQSSQWSWSCNQRVLAPYTSKTEKVIPTKLFHTWSIWAFSDIHPLHEKNTSMAAWNSWTQNVLRSRIFGDQEGVRSKFKKNTSQIIVIFQIGFKQIRLLLEVTENPRSEKIIAHFLRKSQGPTPQAIRDYCLANDGLHISFNKAGDLGLKTGSMSPNPRNNGCLGEPPLFFLVICVRLSRNRVSDLGNVWIGNRSICGKMLQIFVPFQLGDF